MHGFNQKALYILSTLCQTRWDPKELQAEICDKIIFLVPELVCEKKLFTITKLSLFQSTANKFLMTKEIRFEPHKSFPDTFGCCWNIHIFEADLVSCKIKKIIKVVHFIAKTFIAFHYWNVKATWPICFIFGYLINLLIRPRSILWRKGLIARWLVSMANQKVCFGHERRLIRQTWSETKIKMQSLLKDSF